MKGTMCCGQGPPMPLCPARRQHCSSLFVLLQQRCVVRSLAVSNSSTPSLPSPPLPCSCCDLSRSAYDVWVAWTVAGVLGFVLAVMCSGALICDMLAMRRQRVSTGQGLWGG